MDKTLFETYKPIRKDDGNDRNNNRNYPCYFYRSPIMMVHRTHFIFISLQVKTLHYMKMKQDLNGMAY